MPSTVSVDPNLIASAKFIFSGANGNLVDDFNISGVTRMGTGSYSLVFTNPLSNTNYILMMTTDTSGTNPIVVDMATGSFSILVANLFADGLIDPSQLCGAVIGGF